MHRCRRIRLLCASTAQHHQLQYTDNQRYIKSPASADAGDFAYIPSIYGVS